MKLPETKFASKFFLPGWIFLVALFTAGQPDIFSQANKKPIMVKYGMNIKRINVDFKEARFHTEFYWWIIFENDSSKTGYTNEQVLNLEYVNGVDAKTGGIKNEVQLFKNLGPNQFYYTGFHQGDFYFNPDYKMYPLDKQRFDIIIENSLIPAEELKFEIDSLSYINSKQDKNFWGLSNNVLDNNQQANYHIFKSTIRAGNSLYNSNFGDKSLPYQSYYSKLTTSVFIKRSILPYIGKLIIPLFIILFLVYFVYYIPAHKIEMAASLSVSALFCAIGFQLSISNSLPEIGYIIYVDKIFYTCFGLIALSLTESLVTYYLDISGEEYKKNLAAKIDLAFRFIFPLLFFGALILFSIQ